MVSEGGFFYTFEQKSSQYMIIEVYKQPQFTCQVDTVAGSSFTPSVALLVHPSVTVLSKVYCREFTGSQK